MRFYACIIGSEILNGRRVDKHFEFLREALAKNGHTLYASFVIKDDYNLIKNIYSLIKNDPQSVMFSFGGIGSTPDDLTRAIAAEVFTNKPLVRDQKFQQDILDRFGKDAYPHRITMADIPVGSILIPNPINNMSGFSLENRFFFTPGFVEMSHPMVHYIIEKYFNQKKISNRCTFVAKTSENTLIDIMLKVPPYIELSSLPMIGPNGPSVEISLSYDDSNKCKEYFKLFIDFLEENAIEFTYLA